MINKTQMLKGILEGCVLKILSYKSCYSQELVQILKESGFEDLSEGTLFPMLLRLEKDGLFISEKVSTSLGPCRKYYCLSEKGFEELKNFSIIWQDFKSVVDKIISNGGDKI